jgi:hypothetical protein
MLVWKGILCRGYISSARAHDVLHYLRAVGKEGTREERKWPIKETERKVKSTNKVTYEEKVVTRKKEQPKRYRKFEGCDKGSRKSSSKCGRTAK